MVRYYGYYINVSRGKRKMQDKNDAITSVLEPQGSSKEFRKNSAHLIQKIYEIDPLTCPKCSGDMKIISVMENENVIKKILKHLGLWDLKSRPSPMKEKTPGLGLTKPPWTIHYPNCHHRTIISVLIWNTLSKIPILAGRPHSENFKNKNGG